jgi:DinB family protein
MCGKAEGYMNISLQSGATLLEACSVQMEASSQWFKSRGLTLSLEQLRWRPKIGVWSIAECLEHLHTTLDFYLPRMEGAIDRDRGAGRRNSGARALHAREARFLIEFEPPIRDGVIAADELCVGPAVDLDRIADRFHRLRSRYVEATRRAAGLDLAHIAVTQFAHPAIYSLGGTFALLAVHERRHLWQAENIRSTRGFPKSLCDFQDERSL